jgi:hypothetical protein
MLRQARRSTGARRKNSQSVSLRDLPLERQQYREIKAEHD